MKKPLLTTAIAAAAFAATALSTISPSTASEEKKEHKAAAAPQNVPPMSPIPRPENARVYIASPKEGKTVPKTFTIRFGLRGMGVAPAGIYMGEDNPTGHHHLVIDSELPDLKLPLPMDEKNMHFGAGQTEARLTLEPGVHTLQLVLGDHAHIAHDPPLVSEKITITVEE